MRVLSSAGLVLNHRFQDTAATASDSDSTPAKRQKVELETLKDVPLLNLWDTKYRKDVKPIVSI